MKDQWCVIPILLLFLAGCSSRCIDPGVTGRYEITDGGARYMLHLMPGGQGSLDAEGRSLGPLTWELLRGGPQGQMLELTAAGEVYSSLQRLSSPNRPVDKTLGTHGMLESLPQCGGSGVLQKLVIEYDNDRGFARVN